MHWALVLVIAFSWWSAETGHMTWHRWSGYSVIALLAFRLVWGFAGSGTARFATFVKGPRATLAYLRTLPQRAHAATPGHNPLGAWSVLAILATLLVQVATGLFAVDVDGLESGPLSDRVDFDTARAFAHWHRLSFSVLQALVLLHLAAVAFYVVYKRSNLIGPMLSGRRWFNADPELTFAPLWRALLVGLGAIAFAWWASTGFRL